MPGALGNHVVGGGPRRVATRRRARWCSPRTDVICPTTVLLAIIGCAPFVTLVAIIAFVHAGAV